jgi:hypothetical protein
VLRCKCEGFLKASWYILALINIILAYPTDKLNGVSKGYNEVFPIGVEFDLMYFVLHGRALSHTFTYIDVIESNCVSGVGSGKEALCRVKAKI